MDLEIIVDDEVPRDAVYLSVASDGHTLTVTVNPSADPAVLAALRTDIATAVRTTLKPA